MKWSIVYKKAIKSDGSLLFPERLTREFLSEQRRIMGTMLFANQYLNKVISDEDKKFKREWLRYYHTLPEEFNTFAFIDPAIGQKDRNDYTGIAVIHVTKDGDWYASQLVRKRLTPTQIVDLCFEINQVYKPMAIGIEIVAYQEALLYILSERMTKEQRVLPVKGITRTKISKETRILGLVPRFEWGKIYVKQGMTDFEDEYETFPRSAHDDILDSLASLEELVFYPDNKVKEEEKPSVNSSDYEKWYIRSLEKKQGGIEYD